jgi:hypothetical protein
MRAKTYRRTDHAADPYLFDWTSRNLPDCKSFFVSDIDMVVRNRAGCLQLVEIKKKGVKYMRPPQAITYQIIDAGLQAINGQLVTVTTGTWTTKVPVIYFGHHLLTFENTTFENGNVFWNGDQVTEQEVIDLLSFTGNDCCEYPSNVSYG